MRRGFWRKNEILLEPQLKGYSFLDADKYQEIIDIGYKYAKQIYSDKLSFLSQSKKRYETYIKKHRYKPISPIPVINKIKIKNKTFISDETILSKIHQPLNQKLDFKQLQKDMTNIYNMMIFASVDYKIVREDSQNILYIITTPSWNAHGDIRAGIEFEDDFNGHSDYQVRIEYNKYDLNSYGGEWRNRVDIGKRKRIMTEIYQPVNFTQNLYMRLNGYYEKVKHYVTPDFLVDNANLTNDKTLPVESKNFGGILGIGYTPTSILCFEAGLELKSVQPSVDVFI